MTSGITIIILSAISAGFLAYIAWFLWKFAGLKSLYYKTSKKKQIDRAYYLITHSKDEEDMIKNLSRNDITDAEIVKQAKLRITMESGKNGIKSKIQEADRSRTATADGIATADGASQRRDSTTPESGICELGDHKPIREKSRYFN